MPCHEAYSSGAITDLSSHEELALFLRTSQLWICGLFSFLIGLSELKGKKYIDTIKVFDADVKFFNIAKPLRCEVTLMRAWNDYECQSLCFIESKSIHRDETSVEIVQKSIHTYLASSKYINATSSQRISII